MSKLAAVSEGSDQLNDLSFFKEQLRLVVRSNRSRTISYGINTPKKEKVRYQDLRLRHLRYRWDQPTVLEPQELPAIAAHQLRGGVYSTRLSKSQPSSQQRLPALQDKKPRTSWLSRSPNSGVTDHDGPSLESAMITSAEYTVQTPAPLSLSLFREFVCAYNPQFAGLHQPTAHQYPVLKLKGA